MDEIKKLTDVRGAAKKMLRFEKRRKKLKKRLAKHGGERTRSSGFLQFSKNHTNEHQSKVSCNKAVFCVIFRLSHPSIFYTYVSLRGLQFFHGTNAFRSISNLALCRPRNFA